MFWSFKGLISDFLGKFSTVGGQEKYFLVRSQFVAIGPANFFENWSIDNVFMAKMNFE